MTTLDENPNQLDLNLPGLGPDTIFAGAGADFIRTATLGGSLIFGQGDNDTVISVGPNDTIYGGDDEDSIRLQRTPAYAYGDAGADTLIAEARATMYGGAADDFMQGTAEANLMFGNEGADIMLGGAQRRDSLYGGKGNDSIGFFTGAGAGGNNLGLNLTGGLAGTSGNEGSNFLRGDLGNDLVVGINQRDSLYGGKGNDTLQGYGSNNYISGDDDNDTLTVINSTSQFGTTTNLIVGIEKVTLLGGAGNDSLYGGIGNFQSGKNFYDGGDGNDTLVSRAFQDTVLGGAGNDSLSSVTSPGLSSQNSPISSPGYAGSSLLDGGVGNDTIIAGFANDTMIGGDGNDSLSGIFTQAGGGDGDDTINATLFVLPAGSIPTQITLDGGAGNDVLYGNTSTNAVNVFDPGSGNDFMVFGSTGDTLIGDSAGDDTISYSTSTSIVFGSAPNFISDFLGNNSIIGGLGSDSIATGSGNDILIGGVGTDTSGDTLSGGDGNDQLYGDQGDDLLIGGNGNDRIYGGLGADTLNGGSGDDTFYYFNAGEGGTVSGKIDGISDFVVGQDKIAISAAGFDLSRPSAGSTRLPFDNELIVVGSSNGMDAGAAGNRLVYEQLSGILYLDTNGATAGGLVPLASINSPNNRTSLSESDIILF